MSLDGTLDQSWVETPVARLRVEVVSGPNAGMSFESDRDTPVTVGTAPGNTLELKDPKVSRYHLELLRSGGIVTMQDLGSRNGTYLGTVRVERAQVPAETKLRIGDSVLLVRDAIAAPSVEMSVEPISGFVAVSRKSLRLAQTIRQLAASNASVLVRGETGTGKEMVASALHELSDRAKKPFVVVDCGSMAPTLIASELFGHERGAFTGADRLRRGAFERANGGTVFLDEIGELPLTLQPTLLGVLERRRFRRVGGDEEIPVDVRVVSATHRDLRKSVNDGSFRADLYYRLAVARLDVPALRERPEDIPPLVEHFVNEITGEGAGELFGADVLAALSQHRFSGNIRELRNVVESAIAMGDVQLETTEARQSTPQLESPGPSPAEDEELPVYKDARTVALERFEKEYLDKLVARCGTNASEASRVARMDRNYLVSLLRKHGLR